MGTLEGFDVVIRNAVQSVPEVNVRGGGDYRRPSKDRPDPSIHDNHPLTNHESITNH
jgi:hypothetical protein